MTAHKSITIHRAKPKREAQNPTFLGSGFSHESFGMTRDNLAYYSSWSWSCIDKIAEAIASLDSSITVSKGRGRASREEVGSDHWLSLLIDNPNPDFEPSAIWSLAARWFLINGNAYLYTPTYGEPTPQEVWVLPSNRVSVVPGGKGEPLVKGYAYYHEGQRFGIDASEVVHWKFLDPSSDYRTSFYHGRSPINAGIRAVEVDLNNQEFQARYLHNDAVPAFVVTVDESFDVNQFPTFKALWNETFLGASNKGKWGMLHPGMDVKILPSNGQLKEMVTLDESNRDRVCSIWGVPPTIITGDYQARAISENVLAEFHRGTVAPKARRLAEAMTRHARRYGAEAGLRMEFLPYQYNDPTEQRENYRFLVSIGYPPNRIFEEMGLDSVEGGDEPLFNGAPLAQLTTVPAAPTPEPQPEELSDNKHDASPVALAFKAPVANDRTLYAYWKRYDALNESGADRIGKQVAKAFGQLEEEVLKVIAEKASPDSVMKDGLEWTGSLFNLKRWRKIFADLAAPELRRHITRVANESIADVVSDPGGYQSSFSKRVDDLTTNSTSKITTTVDTAKSELESLLKANRGKPVAEVRDAVRAKFQHYSTSGAQRVAQTTATYATGQAQKEAWKMLEEESDNIAGIDRVWLTQRDGDVRDAHKAADGQIAVRGRFQVGGESVEGPGDGRADNAINCRCTTRPRIRRRK